MASVVDIKKAQPVVLGEPPDEVTFYLKPPGQGAKLRLIYMVKDSFGSKEGESLNNIPITELFARLPMDPVIEIMAEQVEKIDGVPGWGADYSPADIINGLTVLHMTHLFSAFMQMTGISDKEKKSSKSSSDG